MAYMQVLERVLGGGVLKALLQGLAGGVAHDPGPDTQGGDERQGPAGTAAGSTQEQGSGNNSTAGSGTAGTQKSSSTNGSSSAQSADDSLLPGWRAAVTSAMSDLRARLLPHDSGADTSPLNLTRLLESSLLGRAWAHSGADAPTGSQASGGQGSSGGGGSEVGSNAGGSSGASSGGQSGGQQQAAGADLWQDAVVQLLQQGHVRWLEALGVEHPLAGGAATTLLLPDL